MRTLPHVCGPGQHAHHGDAAIAYVADALSPDFGLGDSLEVFIRREDAERFIEEVRDDDPELVSYLRIEERELEAAN